MKKKLGIHKRILVSEEGQSTIEFALAVSMSIAFVFFFVHLSMLLAFGNFVHYATFMSARTLQAASDSNEDQTERAREVAIRLLKKSIAQPGTDKYGFIARGDGGSDVPGLILGPSSDFNKKDADLSWKEGVRYRFKARIIPVPLSAGAARDNELTLTSESWLGREPSTLECESELGKKLGGVTFDNGC